MTTLSLIAMPTILATRPSIDRTANRDIVRDPPIVEDIPLDRRPSLGGAASPLKHVAELKISYIT